MKRRILTKAEEKFKHELSPEVKLIKKKGRPPSKSSQETIECFVQNRISVQDIDVSTKQSDSLCSEGYVQSHSNDSPFQIIEKAAPSSNVTDKKQDQCDSQISGKEIFLEMHTKGLNAGNLSKEDLDMFLIDLGKRRNISAETLNTVFQEFLESQRQLIDEIMACLFQQEISQEVITPYHQTKETQSIPSSTTMKGTQSNFIQTENDIIEVLDTEKPLAESEKDSFSNDEGTLHIVMPRTPVSDTLWPGESVIDEELETNSEKAPRPHLDLFKQDKDGDTYLHIATVQRHPAFEKLIHHMKSESLDVQNKQGQTALHLAVLLQRIDDVKHLVCAGASVAVMDCYGDTPLHIACRIGDHNLASHLLNRLVFAPAVGRSTALRTRNYEGVTPLHIALTTCMKSRNQALIRLLLNNDCDIDLQDGKTGKTCLYIALENENYDLAEFLIEKGADVNLETYSGNTPLHIACQAGNEDLVKKLIEKDALLTTRNVDAESAKDVAASEDIRQILEKAMKRERRRKYKEKEDRKKTSRKF